MTFADYVNVFSDLCRQLMNLIEEDNNISSAHKATLRHLANPKSTALFLAEVFIYVVNQNSTSEIINSSNSMAVEKPILKICGIAATNELSDKVEAVRFHPKHEYTLAEYEVRIRQLYEEIANFRECEKKSVNSRRDVDLTPLVFLFTEKISHAQIFRWKISIAQSLKKFVNDLDI